jgi:CRP-like cAMP-binding protein
MTDRTDRPSQPTDDFTRELGAALELRPQRHEAGSQITPPTGGPWLTYVYEGEVLVTVLDRDGQEVLCMHRGPGSLLGIHALEGEVVSTILWALTSVVAATIPVRRVAGWLARNPHPSHLLLRKAIEANRLTLEERISLRGPAATRLARWLMQQPPHPLPRHVLARLLAMTPETLSRILRTFEAAGAITREPELRVLDRERLRGFVRNGDG